MGQNCLTVAGSRDIEVSSDDALRSGDGKWISYQGVLVWGTRYDERIVSQPPDAERAR